VLQAAVPWFSICCKRKKKREGNIWEWFIRQELVLIKAKKQYPKLIHATKHVCDLLQKKGNIWEWVDSFEIPGSLFAAIWLWMHLAWTNHESLVWTFCFLQVDDQITTLNFCMISNSSFTYTNEDQGVINPPIINFHLPNSTIMCKQTSKQEKSMF
jgi:hypothetical protein